MFGLNVDLLELGLETVIETKGEHGVVLYSKDETIEVQALQAMRFTEATGPGDAFRSGFISSYQKGKSHEESASTWSTIWGLKVLRNWVVNYIL